MNDKKLTNKQEGKKLLHKLKISLLKKYLLRQDNNYIYNLSYRVQSQNDIFRETLRSYYFAE